jgi:outer membrane protein assembly factor BamB
MKYRLPNTVVRNSVQFVVCIAASFAFSGIAFCDWPGLLGTNRDGKASEQSSLSDKISGKPKMAWELPAGQGYAGASIAGDQVCLFDRKGRENRARLIELQTGKEIWSQTLPTTFFGGMDADKGPRCVPTITSDGIMLFDSGGEAHYLERATGKIRWTRKLLEEYQAEEGFFGVGSTPLVVNDRVIVVVGGRKGGIVCLGLNDGKTLWSVTKEEASYASPILLSDSKSDVAIVPTRTSIIGLAVADGKEIWKLPFGKKSQSVVAATPLRLTGNRYFLTAAYDVGNVVLEVNETKASVIDRGEILSSQYATPVQFGDYLYGCDGREDFNNGSYKCISTKDWKVAWEEKDTSISHSIVIGDKILVTGVDGTLKAFRPDPKGYQELWKIDLPKGVYRAIPAYEGRTLIMKSESAWFAIDLGA